MRKFNDHQHGAYIHQRCYQTRLHQARKVSRPRTIGTKFADIVVSCLKGLQDEEKGGIFNGEDELVVEVAHVAQVLSKLEEISA